MQIYKFFLVIEWINIFIIIIYYSKQIVNNKVKHKIFTDTKRDSFKDNRRVHIEIFLISRLTSNVVNG